MATDHSKQIEELFDSLVELRPEARRAPLEDARRRVPEIALEVERLLEAHDASTMFFERPAYEGASLLFEGERDISDARTLAPGEKLGSYRVVGEIGRGGMGEVYLAERDDDQFRQRVAIKVVKRGMDTGEVLARFRLERQTLADLRHPNITRLLDGGVTGDGRPYLVMEHIDGLPIDRFCLERGLPVRERLELFCKVCDAVHAAHTNLVVHRDLKPSNILVGDDAEPKLLDFGVAKLLTGDPRDETDRTVAGLRMLTPQFASPEQLRAERVTTATDVYSLGLVLCVMLTGRRPFGEGVDELTRRENPTRPSRLVESSGEARERLPRTLRGDIDTIVLTALRVEPERRYASAQALADDVRRHLRGEPIAARPQTLAYSLAKLVRRRPLESALASVAAVALVVALVVSVVSLRSSERARAAEATQRAEAERSAEESRAAVEFMRTIFASIDPARARGRDTGLLREALDGATGRLEGGHALSPAAEASMRGTIGSTYRAIGEYDRAEPQTLRALELSRERFGDASFETAQAWRRLGVLRLDQTRLRDAEAAFVASIASIDGLLSDAPPDATDPIARERLSALEGLAVARMELGEFAFAERALRELVEGGDASPGWSGVHDARSMLAVALAQLGRLEEAEAILRERLSQLVGAHGEEHPGVIGVMNSLGVTLGRLGRHEEAAGVYAVASERAARVFGASHRNTLSVRRNAAIALDRLGHREEAEREYVATLAAQRETLGIAHADTIATATSYAEFLVNAGELDRAEALFREAIEAQLGAHDERDPVVGILYGGLGACLRAQRRYEEAEEALLRAHSVMLATLGPGHPFTRTTVSRLRALYAPDSMNDPVKLAALDAPDSPTATGAPAPTQAPGPGEAPR